MYETRRPTQSEIEAHIEDLNHAVRRSLLDTDTLRQTADLAARTLFKLLCNFPSDLQPLILQQLNWEHGLRALVDKREYEAKGYQGPQASGSQAAAHEEAEVS